MSEKPFVTTRQINSVYCIVTIILCIVIAAHLNPLTAHNQIVINYCTVELAMFLIGIQANLLIENQLNKTAGFYQRFIIIIGYIANLLWIVWPSINYAFS